MAFLNRKSWALNYIDPMIEKVILPDGRTYEKNGYMYPACGHRPEDYKIVGFGYFGEGKKWLSAFGYHVVDKGKGRHRYLARGGWDVEKIKIYWND